MDKISSTTFLALALLLTACGPTPEFSSVGDPIVHGVRVYDLGEADAPPLAVVPREDPIGCPVPGPGTGCTHIKQYQMQGVFLELRMIDPKLMKEFGGKYYNTVGRKFSNIHVQAARTFNSNGEDRSSFSIQIESFATWRRPDKENRGLYISLMNGGFELRKLHWKPEIDCKVSRVSQKHWDITNEHFGYLTHVKIHAEHDDVRWCPGGPGV